MGQCNFSIAPAIYHFLILYVSFANLKNFGSLRLHLHSRFINFSQSVDFVPESNLHRCAKNLGLAKEILIFTEG